MVFVGNICEVCDNKGLVKVNYQGTISKFIPYLAIANSFKRKFVPPRVNEQVLMFQGENGNAKFALGAIFSQRCKEPSGACTTKEISQYEDGTTISYDTSSSTLEITNPKVINIVVQNDINITCKNANLTAQKTTIKSPNVQILGNTNIQGAITTSGDSGGSGEFSINGNLKISGNMKVGSNLNVGGSITDARGNLTNHTNNGYTRD
jgi:phage-related baseplate assembly protein